MTSVNLGLPQVRLTGQEASPPERPATDALIDSFGRIGTDLRVSLTDKCNLRCTYCMPEAGLDWLPNDQVLTDDEIIRLVTLSVERLGITEVRFTGGEPLLRKGLEKIIGATARLRTQAGAAIETSLTTNAMGLRHRAQRLVDAGLTRINVSLDTLDAERFNAITHRDRHHEVIAGLEAARAAGLDPIKINAVLLPGVNDGEAATLLEWALEHDYQLRFIEQMPIDAQGAWDRDSMITAAQILESLNRDFELAATDPTARGAAPAETWLARSRVTDASGIVGVIGSVTRNFCASCDRTRLTADGQIRNCLFSTSETDLRSLLRDGSSDEQIMHAWQGSMWRKKAGHGIDVNGTGDGFANPSRSMSAIGG
ncbi:GTP 3',8-cyclase MoaA [Saxibacter everestensis]|uniref:GTP 3',8-cyclase n=1 Tax=Saxibacter everestensis TaxID=2909229 RepID=A0ABY8QW62_9MICO|nr:GTP 3',8-cyclase MoaA [Brevibacteriaceae bacterium ZFBP1038]